MSALIFKNYLFKCFNNLSLKVAIFAFKILITSISEAPFKVFKVLAQTFTFIGLPLTTNVVTCKFGFHRVQRQQFG